MAILVAGRMNVGHRMDAGKMDRRVQFRRATMTDDGFSSVETWADHGLPVWAARKDMSDGERMRAGQVLADLVARFTVRSSAFSRDLTPRDRMTCDGREWDILGIKELGRRDWMEITALARAD